ncbi:MAG: type II toxin-antitoxin system VapC family toxin [Verrucomicrobia bacterium]|nr:type II toxin-antitoxin system VapC family toxin [Verrucomicrobiota bacterium]
MNVYLDTSVVLSHFLNQPNRLRSWGAWEACYTSALTRLEFYRTVDRLRLNGVLSDDERVELQRQFNAAWDAMHRVGLSEDLLARAATSMPTVLGSLDAIHLVTALTIGEARRITVTLLTHDNQLATGALAMGMAVEGVTR